MSAAWKIKLSQLSVESLRDLYSRDIISPDVDSLIGEVLKQKALQTATLTATALAVTVTGIAGANISVQNSTTGQESQQAIDSPSTVHWQSAFWALVVIALNSCLQDSGNICEIEAKLGLLVKSSPVFCAVDSLIVWGQILYYLTRVTPREALRIVSRSRQQHDRNAQEESTSLPLVIGRGLLSVLAILQGLKLYALGGIPWTQAFGTMYLVSYTTNALLNILGKPQTPDDPPRSDMRRGDILPSTWLIHCFAVFAACFQIAIWTTIVRAALPNEWLTILAGRSCRWPVDAVTILVFTPIWLYVLILICGASAIDTVILLLPSAGVLFAMNALISAFLPSLLNIVADAFGCGAQTMSWTFAILCSLVMMLVETCLLGLFPVTTAMLSNDYLSGLFRHIEKEWDTCTPYSLAFLALAVTAMISHFLHRVFFMGSMARKLKVTSFGMSSNLAWACLFMFLANVSLALLYYGHVYSPEGTSKPSWTDNLGRKIV